MPTPQTNKNTSSHVFVPLLYTDACKSEAEAVGSLLTSYGFAVRKTDKLRTEVYLDAQGNPKKRKMVDLKAVTDERICDGFYYASAFKIIKKMVENPELLEIPPEKVVEDID